MYKSKYLKYKRKLYMLRGGASDDCDKVKSLASQCMDLLTTRTEKMKAAEKENSDLKKKVTSLEEIIEESLKKGKQCKTMLDECKKGEKEDKIDDGKSEVTILKYPVAATAEGREIERKFMDKITTRKQMIDFMLLQNTYSEKVTLHPKYVGLLTGMYVNPMKKDGDAGTIISGIMEKLKNFS